MTSESGPKAKESPKHVERFFKAMVRDYHTLDEALTLSTAGRLLGLELDRHPGTAGKEEDHNRLNAALRTASAMAKSAIIPSGRRGE